MEARQQDSGHQENPQQMKYITPALAIISATFTAITISTFRLFSLIFEKVTGIKGTYLENRNGA